MACRGWWTRPEKAVWKVNKWKPETSLWAPIPGEGQGRGRGGFLQSAPMKGEGTDKILTGIIMGGLGKVKDVIKVIGKVKNGIIRP